MMDRFKFRVWDKVHNRYWTDEEIKENAAWLLVPDDNDNINNVEIEQCTGVHDNNGKLVFEGDIVEVLCEIPNIFKIEWDNIGLMWCCRSEKFDMPLYELRESRVIGNIHKNPELGND